MHMHRRSSSALAPGSTWVVTGHAGGIGQAVVALLRARGARVVGWDRAEPMFADDRFVDVADPDVVVAAAADLERPIAGVVHCAGILHTGTLETVDVRRQLDVVRINLGGTVAVLHALVPRLQERGSIILIGSASALLGPPEFAAYAATKAGMSTLAESLRIELADRRIHIGVCTPLFTDTAMIRTEEPAALLRSTGVVHGPQDVAASIVRGIDRRRERIMPGFRVHAMSLVARNAAWLGPPLMRRAWRRARRT